MFTSVFLTYTQRLTLWQVREKIVAQLSASTNVCKDFKCFNEHESPHLL